MPRGREGGETKKNYIILREREREREREKKKKERKRESDAAAAGGCPWLIRSGR